MLALAASARPLADRSYARRLRRYGPLSEDDWGELETLLVRTETYSANQTIGGDSPPFFLVSGWACLSRSLRDGRRQILAFILPGEGVGFDLLTRKQSSVDVVALTPLKVRHARDTLPPLSERLGRVFAGAAAARQGRLLDQVVRLGRQTAYERMAHLLLELHGRLLEIGEARPDGFHLPVKQEVLADALGLSLVHVNRTLQQLRRDRLIDVRGAQVMILDRPTLEAAADQRP
jgi:CRP-like cAMP-binding protein